jgi:hypothetical protein
MGNDKAALGNEAKLLGEVFARFIKASPREQFRSRRSWCGRESEMVGRSTCAESRSS